MNKKEKISHAALELFTSQGYSQTSVQEIADQAGVAQTTVLYHFKSKHLLLESIIENVIQHINYEVDEDDPFKALLKYLRSNLLWAYKTPQEAHVLLMLFNFSKSEPELKDKATAMIDKGRLKIFELLKKMDTRESHDSLLNLSRVIQQYINAVMFQILVRNNPKEEYELATNSLEEDLKRLLRL